MISVVIPTYNQSRYIRAAVESVLDQSYRDIEVIVVDDASTDATYGILMSMVAYNPRLQVVRHGHNTGTGAALNTGFSIAQGEVETWFASDNIMYPDCLEKLYRHMMMNPLTDYVYSNCEIGIMAADGITETACRLLTQEVGSQEFSRDRLMEHYFLGICWLWRKELRLKTGGRFQEEPCEDYDMVLRMAEEGGRFTNIPDVLGWFRRHPDNMSNRIRREKGPDHYSRFVQAKAKERSGVKVH